MRLHAFTFIGLVTFAGLELHTPRIAEACGRKLTIKPTAPRVVPRTSNPSPVLLVGAPPARLGRDLALAGHRVEVTSDAAQAKRPAYAVVIVDTNDQAKAARNRFASATVIVRSGDVRADIDTVESRVARRPIAVARSRVTLAVRQQRVPLRAGSDVEQVADGSTSVNEMRVLDVVAPPSPVAEELHEEVSFAVGKASVGNAGALRRTVEWLTANPAVGVTVAGYADPTGTPELNLRLSRTRAEAVRDYLVGKGIDSSRIEIKALGDTQLKYGASDGRNRRVAIDAK